MTACRTCYHRFCVSCQRWVKVFCHCTHGELSATRKQKTPAYPSRSLDLPPPADKDGGYP